MNRLRWITPVLLCLAMAVAVACGGGGDDDDAGPAGPNPGGGNGDQAETGSEEDLVAAAEASFQAFLDGDSQAYYLSLSDRCRDEHTFSSVEAWVDGRRFGASRTGGVDLEQVTIEDVTVSGFDGSTADIALVLEGLPGERTFRETLPQSWLVEEGEWRLDECSDVRPPQGGTEGAGRDRNNPLELGFIADVNGWVLVVRHITLDAEDHVLETEGNQPAGPGKQYVYVQIGGGYNGGEASLVIGDELQFDFVNGARVYGDDAPCGNGIIDALDRSRALGPGDNLLGGFCAEVDEGEVDDDLLLRVTHIPTGDEFWFQVGE